MTCPRTVGREILTTIVVRSSLDVFFLYIMLLHENGHIIFL